MIKWMNEQMVKQISYCECKVVDEVYLCNSRINILKVLLLQQTNTQIIKWMTERTDKQMRDCGTQILQVDDKCSESAFAKLHRSLFLPTAAKNDVLLH